MKQPASQKSSNDLQNRVTFIPSETIILPQAQEKCRSVLDNINPNLALNNQFNEQCQKNFSSYSVNVDQFKENSANLKNSYRYQLMLDKLTQYENNYNLIDWQSSVDDLIFCCSELIIENPTNSYLCNLQNNLIELKSNIYSIYNATNNKKPVPKILHFILLGSGLSEQQQSYLNLWSKANNSASYEFNLYFDGDALLIDSLRTTIHESVVKFIFDNAYISSMRPIDKAIINLLTRDYNKHINEILELLKNIENSIYFFNRNSLFNIIDIRSTVFFRQWKLKNEYHKELLFNLNPSGASSIARLAILKRKGGFYSDINTFPPISDDFWQQTVVPNLIHRFINFCKLPDNNTIELDQCSERLRNKYNIVLAQAKLNWLNNIDIQNKFFQILLETNNEWNFSFKINDQLLERYKNESDTLYLDDLNIFITIIKNFTKKAINQVFSLPDDFFLEVDQLRFAPVVGSIEVYSNSMLVSHNNSSMIQSIIDQQLLDYQRIINFEEQLPFTDASTLEDGLVCYAKERSLPRSMISAYKLALKSEQTNGINEDNTLIELIPNDENKQQALYLKWKQQWQFEKIKNSYQGTLFYPLSLSERLFYPLSIIFEDDTIINFYHYSDDFLKLYLQKIKGPVFIKKNQDPLQKNLTNDLINTGKENFEPNLIEDKDSPNEFIYLNILQDIKANLPEILVKTIPVVPKSGGKVGAKSNIDKKKRSYLNKKNSITGLWFFGVSQQAKSIYDAFNNNDTSIAYVKITRLTVDVASISVLILSPKLGKALKTTSAMSSGWKATLKKYLGTGMRRGSGIAANVMLLPFDIPTTINHFREAANSTGLQRQDAYVAGSLNAAGMTFGTGMATLGIVTKLAAAGKLAVGLKAAAGLTAVVPWLAPITIGGTVGLIAAGEIYRSVREVEEIEQYVKLTAWQRFKTGGCAFLPFCSLIGLTQCTDKLS